MRPAFPGKYRHFLLFYLFKHLERFSPNPGLLLEYIYMCVRARAHKLFFFNNLRMNCGKLRDSLCSHIRVCALGAENFCKEVQSNSCRIQVVQFVQRD